VKAFSARNTEPIRRDRFSACRSERGFSLVEILITTGLLIVIVGAASTLFVDISKGHVAQQDASEMQQNERFAMDAILRAVRGAGNNPLGLHFDKFDLDPDGDGRFNSVRIRSDFNPPDGDLNDPEEVVLFSVSNGVLQMTDELTGTTTELAHNIAGMTLLFFDSSSNPYANVAALTPLQSVDPDTGSVMTNVNALRTVQVTLAGRTTRNDLRTGAKRELALTDRISIRSGI
jgi:type II secretory pathway pseudopilin PulG